MLSRRNDDRPASAAASQMAKWTTSAILSGADAIKLGFVSRAAPRDAGNHVVLSVHVRLGSGGGQAAGHRS
jgi:hypothetical protein